MKKFTWRLGGWIPKGDESRLGGASSFLAQRLEEGGEVKVFVRTTITGTLKDDNTPIIMVIWYWYLRSAVLFKERESNDAEGKSWLFFGDRTFHKFLISSWMAEIAFKLNLH